MTPDFKKRLCRVQDLLRFQLLADYIFRGLAAGALLSVILFIVSKFAPIGVDIIRLSLTFIVTTTAAGAIAALLKPITAFDAAFACDIKLGLKERLTSAIEFDPLIDNNPLIPALISDADRHAKKIRPLRDFPIRPPREILFALAFILVTVGLYFVPPWQYAIASDEQRNEYALVQSEAQNIRELAREIRLDPPAERTGLAEEIARELDELARDMEFGTLTRREALERLSAIEEALEQSQEDSGYNELREQLDRLAQALQQSENLSEASDALAEGDMDRAQQALNRLGEDLAQGRIPPEELSNLADALDRAVNEMQNNPGMGDVSRNLAAARDQLRAAASANSGSSGEQQGSQPQADPGENAQQLINAINSALPQIDSLDVPQGVKDQVRELLESARDSLQEALDSGEATRQDIAEAQEKIQEAQQLLEDAGVNTSGEEDQRSTEDIARQLAQEAERLNQAAGDSRNLDEQTRSDLQSQCQSIAEELNNQISQGTTSEESNQEAREQLDQIREQLEQSGASQEQMGQRTQCQSGQQGQSGQEGQSGQSPSGLSSLFSQSRNPGQGGQQGNQGQSGQQGQNGQQGENGQYGQCLGQAGRSLQQAGQCLGQQNQSMESGNRFNKIQSGLQSSRSCIGGQSQGGRNSQGQSGQNGGNSQGGQAGSGWGTWTASGSSTGSRVTSGHQNNYPQETGEEANETREYQDINNSAFKPSQSYDVQLQGQFTEDGGSYIFTEITDPDTGEKSYVPYFSFEQADVDALMDAVEDQDIPRSYADFVRAYFERLANGTQAGGTESSE